MSDPLDEQSSLVGILNRVQGWTIAVDQKVSVITAVQTLVCGFLFPELRDWLQVEYTSIYIKVFLFTGGGLLVVGIGLSLRALFPVIKSPMAKSATFFGTIQSWTPDDYRDKLAAMDVDAWKADYVSQIHICSVITTRKYQLAQQAVNLFVAGLVVIGGCYIAALAGF